MSGITAMSGTTAMSGKKAMSPLTKVISGLFAALTLISVTLVWLLTANPNYVFITDADVMDPASYDYPDANAQWRPTSLPRSWSRDPQHDNALEYAWYRIPLPEAVRENGWTQILMLRHIMNVEIWLDQHYLGSGGPASPDNLQRNWNRPVMWHIPEAWLTGENQMLYFRLHSVSDFGVMSPFFMGQTEALQQRYRIHHFLQIELVKIGLMAMFFIAALSLFAWLETQNPRWMLTLLMSLSWSLPLSYIVAPSVTFGEMNFLRLTHWGTVTGAVCLLAFVYAYYLSTPLRRLRWLALLPVLHGAVLIATPKLQIVAVGSAGQLLLQLLFVVLLVKLFRHGTAPRRQLLAVSAGLLIMLLAALHDITLVLSTATTRWRWDMLWAYITQPVMLLILTWLGLAAFKKGTSALRNLNRLLQTRLSAAENNIKQVYADQEILEREVRVAAEREAIYRDLHDDLGAKLLSLVLKSERGPIRDLARSALQDLRDIVSRVANNDSVLAAALADSMAEHEGRASGLGIAFDWDIDAATEDLICHSSLILKMRLLLRELISNTLWQEDVQRIEFVARLDQQQLTLRLSHDAPTAIALSPLLRKRLAALNATLQPALPAPAAQQDLPHCLSVSLPVVSEPAAASA